LRASFDRLNSDFAPRRAKRSSSCEFGEFQVFNA